MSAEGLSIAVAESQHIEGILQLYLQAYGTSYPLKFGTDREVMADAITSNSFFWPIMVDDNTGKVVGSCIFELDLTHRIGKLSGVVVHPDYRKQNIASDLIAYGCSLFLEQETSKEYIQLNSIYTTTRTVSLGPQLMCLKNKFIPLGIFPNAHKLEEYETVTLLGRYRNGILERRTPITSVPEKIMKILKIQDKNLGVQTEYTPYQLKAHESITSKPLQFEVIHAPNYVKHLFEHKQLTEYERFYPFHEPNTLIVSADGQLEVFAYMNKKDRYMVIISLSQPLYTLKGCFERLLFQLESIGVSYIELMIGCEHSASIQMVLDANFQPSAVYPAMKVDDDHCQDFVFLSRSLYPLDFRKIKLNADFHPYLKQYMELWKEMNLDSLEVFDGTY